MPIASHQHLTVPSACHIARCSNIVCVRECLSWDEGGRTGRLTEGRRGGRIFFPFFVLTQRQLH